MRALMITLAAATALAVPAAALAHDIWVVPQKRDGATVGVVRYADPQHLELPDFHKIVVLEVVSPGGAKINLKRPLSATLPGRPPALETKPFTAPAGSILAVTLDNGFYAVDPVDKVESNTSKLLIANPTESWWVPKFGKTLLGKDSWKIRTNTLIELVPLSDPYAGDKTLKVRLDVHGKPMAGVKVVYGDGVSTIAEKDLPSATTGKDGVATIDISRKGSWLLTAETLTAPTRPDLADKDEIYATLAFDTLN